MNKKTAAKKIYCAHDWQSGYSGSVWDAYRTCDRCDSIWRATYRTDRTKARRFFSFPSGKYVYGKEPQAVIGVVR